MERYRFGRVVVKVGSNVLTRDDGTLDTTRMSALSDQIAQLHRGGVEIILVSSGAVAAGRSELGTERKLDSVSARQLFSAVGQVKLINRYYELMRDRGILCGQVLTTKESFSTRRHYLNQQHCMTVMLDHGVIPIVNENDTVSVTELMFTDNDELSGLIAAMMDAGFDKNQRDAAQSRTDQPAEQTEHQQHRGKTQIFAFGGHGQKHHQRQQQQNPAADA